MQALMAQPKLYWLRQPYIYQMIFYSARNTTAALTTFPGKKKKKIGLIVCVQKEGT